MNAINVPSTVTSHHWWCSMHGNVLPFDREVVPASLPTCHLIGCRLPPSAPHWSGRCQSRDPETSLQLGPRVEAPTGSFRASPESAAPRPGTCARAVLLLLTCVLASRHIWSRRGGGVVLTSTPPNLPTVDPGTRSGWLRESTMCA